MGQLGSQSVTVQSDARRAAWDGLQRELTIDGLSFSRGAHLSSATTGLSSATPASVGSGCGRPTLAESRQPAAGSLKESKELMGVSDGVDGDGHWRHVTVIGDM